MKANIKTAALIFCCVFALISVTYAQNTAFKIDIPTNTTFTYGLQINSPWLFPQGTPITSLFDVQSVGFQGNAFTLFRIRTNGSIGIGTDSPRSRLHVENGRIQITGNNSNGGPMIVFGGDANNAPNGQWGIEYISGGVAGLNFWKPDQSVNFGNYKMFLADDGKVTIGIDPNDPNVLNGDYLLYVAEGIITERLKVAIEGSNDWSDYVFEPDYSLLSLEQVQEFIDANGHLPGVPSAEDVAKNGIDVASMDAKLLEKIEELTLYILNQEERISELEAQIKQ